MTLRDARRILERDGLSQVFIICVDKDEKISGNAYVCYEDGDDIEEALGSLNDRIAGLVNGIGARVKWRRTTIERTWSKL